MDKVVLKRNAKRASRVLRVRKKLRGNASKPRLSVYRTNRNISVQLIDDENHVTLASAGTNEKAAAKGKASKKSKETAKQIGHKIAEKAKGLKIERVIFDRGHLKYHGLIAELANAAREAGLQF